MAGIKGFYLSFRVYLTRAVNQCTICIDFSGFNSLGVIGC